MDSRDEKTYSLMPKRGTGLYDHIYYAAEHYPKIRALTVVAVWLMIFLVATAALIYPLTSTAWRHSVLMLSTAIVMAILGVFMAMGTLSLAILLVHTLFREKQWSLFKRGGAHSRESYYSSVERDVARLRQLAEIEYYKNFYKPYKFTGSSDSGTGDTWKDKN